MKSLQGTSQMMVKEWTSSPYDWNSVKCLLSPLLLDVVLEVLTCAVWAGWGEAKQRKRHTDWKAKRKSFYLKMAWLCKMPSNPANSPSELTWVVVIVHRAIYKSQLYFHIPTTTKWKIKVKYWLTLAFKTWTIKW